MNSLKKIVVFGGTSAIAEAVMRRLVEEGASVFFVGRSTEKVQSIMNDLNVRSTSAQKIKGVVADLSDTTLHQKLVEESREYLGGLDAALIAYGTLPNQKECERDPQKALTEIHVNGSSIAHLLLHLAHYFEEKKTGVIGVISSVAGDRGRKSNYVYGSAKGMLSLFLQGLRNRLCHCNVDVVTIKPGFVDTPMTSGFKNKGILWAQPDTIAQGIIKSMKKGKNSVYLPSFWFWIMLIIKNIPEFIFKKLSL